MPKDHTKLIVGAGLLAICVQQYYALKNRQDRAASRVKNFEVASTAFDFQFHIDQVVEAARLGQLRTATVFLSGMTEAEAKSVARENEFVHFTWAPVDVGEAVFETESISGPWVAAFALPIQGPGAGVLIGDPMSGTFDERRDDIRQAVQYAATGRE